MNDVKPDSPKQPPPIKDAKPETPAIKLPPSVEEPKPAKPISPTKPVKPEKPEKPSKEKPSFLVRAVRWLILFLIVFGAGALLALFGLYVPARNEISRANQKIDEASSQYKTELQEANQEIERLSSLDEENISLQESLDQATIQLNTLQVRNDILAAQLALVDENADEARLALSQTPKILEELAAALPEHQELIAQMQERLEFTLKGIENENYYAASSDLDVLYVDLLRLEEAVIR
jgi:cytoskeletal protein RodZ